MPKSNDQVSKGKSSRNKRNSNLTLAVSSWLVVKFLRLVRFLGVFIQKISKMSIAKCPFLRYIFSQCEFLYRFLSLFNFLNRDKEAPTSWKSKLKNKLPHIFTFIIAFSLTIIKCFLIYDYIFIHKVSYKNITLSKGLYCYKKKSL